MKRDRAGLFVGLALGLFSVGAASGGVDANGYDWVTVGDVGNPAFFDAPTNSVRYGRGSVDYEYNISRMEISTAQWLEFVNTFSTQSTDLGLDFLPIQWGAEFDGSYQGDGFRYKLRTDVDGANLPVDGIRWRSAAQYANWLHNGKGSDLSTLETGAYDTSTWGEARDEDGRFLGYTDDERHLPGAKYWIPTLDEMMKASYYDPSNPDDGWWGYTNGSDIAPVPGPPGVGDSTAGYPIPDDGAWEIPIGAYEDVMSPYGLLDLASGGADLIEDWFPRPGSEYPRDRHRIKSFAEAPIDSVHPDCICAAAQVGAQTSSHGTIRLASRVPSPGTVLIFGFGLAASLRNRRA